MKIKALRLFPLLMVNLSAVGVIRSWPIVAEFGLPSLFYLLVASFAFLIPVASITAELSTTWPKAGGIFTWIKEAFGEQVGFLCIWILWIENLFWYPILLSFLAATVSYVVNPSLASEPSFLVTLMLGLFWFLTFMNYLGIKVSNKITTLGVLLGTFVTAILIVSLSFLYYLQGNSIQLEFSFKNFFPSKESSEHLTFFTGIILSFSGLEMSGIYAKDVENPKKTFPKVLLLSVLILFFLSSMGILSIAMIVPLQEISLLSGSIQTFAYLFKAYGLKELTPYVAALLVLGGIGSLNTWLIGPSKGLLAAAEQGHLPRFLSRKNHKGVPTTLLFLQALIVSFLSLLFLFSPSVNSTYFMILMIVAELYLILYIFMFCAAIRLRYSQPQKPRGFRVPGGNLGMWGTAGTGIVTCLFCLGIGFFPPKEFVFQGYLTYEICVIFGILLGCALPLSFCSLSKKKEAP